MVCLLCTHRELAFQLTEQIEALGAGIGVKCATVIGGIGMKNRDFHQKIFIKSLALQLLFLFLLFLINNK